MTAYAPRLRRKRHGPYRSGPDDMLGGLLIILTIWLALRAAPLVDETILRWTTAVVP